jgi:Zn-dependent peptidase ImmA (M78 family)
MIDKNNKPRTKFAGECAKKLLNNIGIKNPPILIKEVVNYLKKYYNLSIYSWDFEDKTEGIQINKGEKEMIIGYNKNKHPHRQRFTIAHEIGHFLLGHTSKNHNFDSNEDIEANQFAGELLVPSKMIKEDFKNKRRDLKSLSIRYNVSEEVICICLMNYKLFNKI